MLQFFFIKIENISENFFKAGVHVNPIVKIFPEIVIHFKFTPYNSTIQNIQVEKICFLNNHHSNQMSIHTTPPIHHITN